MRTSTTLLVATVLALGGASVAQAQKATEYWPNQVGNEWTYELSGSVSSGTDEARVTQESSGWVEIEGLADTQWWYMSSRSGKVWVWNATSGNYELAFDLAAGRGNSFVTKFPDPCTSGTTYQVTDASATVDTPVGRLSDCILVSMTRPICADAGVTGFSFAKGIGIVEYSWQTIAGPQTAKLVHAVVNGKEYKKPAPAATGLSVCVTLDAYTYYHTDVRPPAMAPSRLATVKATLEVKNQTNETVTFDSGGQEYDFLIKNSSGRTVYRWSNGRAFIEILRRNRLDPGQSLRYEETIVLKDNSGTPLPTGNYTLEGVHTTTPDSLRGKATVPFALKRRTIP